MNETLYERYAKIRDLKGFTDYKVANITEIGTPTISNWKKGKYTPKEDKLRKIAACLDVTYEYMIGKTDMVVCPVCGFGDNPLSEQSRKEHEDFHSRFLLAKETYPFIMIFCLGIHFFFSGYFPGFMELDVSLFYLRNGLYFGLPLFALGYLMARYNFHTKSWFKYLYLGLGIFFFFFQIIDARGLILEMYPSSVLASIFLIQFFLGLKPTKSNFYYKWFGKNMPFYIYILHVAVARIIPGHSGLTNTYFKAILVFIMSFVIYEILYLLLELYRKINYKLRMKG